MSEMERLERAQRHALYAAFACAMAGSFFLGVLATILAGTLR